MIVDKIKGDIVELMKKGCAVAHGCNCHHAMNSGVAAALATAFPGIRAVDNETVYGADKRGGHTFYRDPETGGTCTNLYTQFYPGADASYGAIAMAFEYLNEIIKKNGTNRTPLFIPKIGAGVGGLEWRKVANIIDIVTPNIPIVLVEWDHGEPLMVGQSYPRPPKMGLDVLLMEQ